MEIDGKLHDIPQGSDPIEVSLAPGDHTLRIEQPEYEKFSQNVTMEPGKDLAVEPKWIAVDGYLVVTLPQNTRQVVNVEIDGKANEILPQRDSVKVPLPPGEHSLRIEPPGYHSLPLSVTIEAEKTQSVSPKWVATVAQLTAAYEAAKAQLDAAEEKYANKIKPAETC